MISRGEEFDSCPLGSTPVAPVSSLTGAAFRSFTGSSLGHDVRAGSPGGGGTGARGVAQGVSARRLVAFLDGCGADADLREALPQVLGQRSRATYDLLHGSRTTGLQPWATMYREGPGEHWLKTVRFIADHHARITATAL